jgi:hypothetical protein
MNRIWWKMMDKVKQGFARIIPWKELCKNLPSKLKASPIAAIPHKSCLFRMILDLSFGFRHLGEVHPSVNDTTTDDAAPLAAMSELGRVPPRIIHALATTPVDGMPLLFAKLDIKVGFWRMVVPEEDQFNFAYVLPQPQGSEDSEPMIVVPSSLQMGWKHSPPYFCAASKTGRDVGEHLLHQPIGSLPAHPFEQHMLNLMDPALLLDSTDHPTQWDDAALPAYSVKLGSLLATHKADFFKLLEVYVDDSIGVLHSNDLEVLHRVTRAMLHGIHSVFTTLASPKTTPSLSKSSLLAMASGQSTKRSLDGYLMACFEPWNSRQRKSHGSSTRPPTPSPRNGTLSTSSAPCSVR